MSREALDLIANQVEAWEAVHVKLDAEPHHHVTSTRDDVWLENGVISRGTTYGVAESITDVDGLQALILPSPPFTRPAVPPSLCYVPFRIQARLAETDGQVDVLRGLKAGIPTARRPRPAAGTQNVGRPAEPTAPSLRRSTTP
jgi:hypothetical protein